MSAQNYNRIPSVTAQARRHPLANAPVNQATTQHAPAKPQEPVKPPASPPLPRQNTKTAPPSPPKIIEDKSRGFSYKRVGFLGEVSQPSHLGRPDADGEFQGGFARVYEIETANRDRLACKVVTKNSLKTKKAKTKVCLAERRLPETFIDQMSSCTPKSRSTSPWTIPTSLTSKNVSRTMQTFT